MSTTTDTEQPAARLAEIDLALADNSRVLTDVARLLLLYEAMALCQSQGDDETWQERYLAPASRLVEEGHASQVRVDARPKADRRKPSQGQAAVLAAMAQGNLFLRAHSAQGHVAPLYPTRVISLVSPSDGRERRRVLPATRDALWVGGLIRERSRAVSGFTSQGEYRWITWETDFELTERARAYLAERQGEPQ